MIIIEDFEIYVISKGLKLTDVNERIINEFCTEIFYDIEDEEDINKLNALEEEIRNKYLGE